MSRWPALLTTIGVLLVAAGLTVVMVEMPSPQIDTAGGLLAIIGLGLTFAGAVRWTRSWSDP
ncbi:hypothetical protein [Janibacter anophelis]|uniref:hypothetical protein n=1 Tax=Janibacter anophelis TaxID=319054 RepID=UPI000DEEFAAB|nr:hypothetical protein [Janibacter anophelis]